MKHEFDNEVKYKLYRSINEILHPTISKKNISDYRIIIKEDILPVRVFYPKKVTSLEKVIIYIHGNGEVTECEGEYANICKKISKKLDTLVVAIDFQKQKNNYKKMYNDIYETVKYLYEGFELNNILYDNIVLMGDSTGANIISYINSIKDDNCHITKEVLFYPVINFNFMKEKYPSWSKYQEFNINLFSRLKRYYNYIKEDDDYLNFVDNSNNKLIVIGNVDCLKDEVLEYYLNISNDNENNKYLEFPFLGHGFLKKMDKDVENSIFEEVNNFINDLIP